MYTEFSRNFLGIWKTKYIGEQSLSLSFSLARARARTHAHTHTHTHICKWYIAFMQYVWRISSKRCCNGKCVTSIYDMIPAAEDDFLYMRISLNTSPLNLILLKEILSAVLVCSNLSFCKHEAVRDMTSHYCEVSQLLSAPATRKCILS
jgi:hypothetical protein